MKVDTYWSIYFRNFGSQVLWLEFAKKRWDLLEGPKGSPSLHPRTAILGDWPRKCNEVEIKGSGAAAPPQKKNKMKKRKTASENSIPSNAAHINMPNQKAQLVKQPFDDASKH